MPAILSLVLIAAAAVLCWKLAKQLESKRRKKAAGGEECLEYRTDLAFDECLDALAARTPEDEFEYDCARQPEPRQTSCTTPASATSRARTRRPATPAGSARATLLRTPPLVSSFPHPPLLS